MNTTQQYGLPISLAMAKSLAQAAEAEAKKNGWNMVIAIVDSAARIALVHRMDHAQYGSIDVALAKAKTAVNFKRSTKGFDDAVANGGPGLRLLALDGICPIEGAVPIILDGMLVGAIGVSGAKPREDGVVANAALQAIDG